MRRNKVWLSNRDEKVSMSPEEQTFGQKPDVVWDEAM